MAAAETLQARRAALLVHGLSPHQRSLVMAKLGAAETSRLQPMLEELSRIGIPSELSLGSPTREPTAIERAAELDAESVLRALETCAASTIGHILRSHEWPWRAEVFERLPEPRRTRALDKMQLRLRPLAPAAVTFLCARLCAEAERVTALPRLDPGSKVGFPHANSWGSNRWRPHPWHNAGSGVKARFKRWIGWGR